MPGLADRPPPVLNVLVLLAAGGAIALLVASRALRGHARARAMRWAALAAAMIPVLAAHHYGSGMIEYVLAELEQHGMALEHQMPVWMTIIGGLAGTLFTLSLIFLGIRYFFTFFTTVSMGGVAIGTMALVMTLSVMSGFETDLRRKILGSNAHVLVTRHDETPFAGYRDVMEKAARVRGVVAQTPVPDQRGGDRRVEQLLQRRGQGHRSAHHRPRHQPGPGPGRRGGARADLPADPGGRAWPGRRRSRRPRTGRASRAPTR